ncbi:hypothetical protein ACB092_01G200500 [Castanea dentata]
MNFAMEEHEDNNGGDISQKAKKHEGKHDKPKPWDDDPNIDRWTIETFDPSWNESGMLELSSFSTLFPQYRERYLQEVWPTVKSALKEFGVSCELNLVEGSMTVSTTRKTRDPYIIIKARELIRLLSRSVPVHQAIKVLDDEVQCDIIKIGNLVRSKGNTVAAMGSFKGLKQVRRIVEDCILNKMHPVYHIKVLMMKKELEKDPALANENWDRFLPKFKKKNVQQKKLQTKDKKPYTPFPPPQQPSKIDEQLESGEFFMSQKKKSAKTWQEKQEKQTQKTAENKRKREAAFIPPQEPRKQDTKSEDGDKDVAAMAMSLKKKAKEFGKQKLGENVNAEVYIATAGEPSKKKSKRRET